MKSLWYKFQKQNLLYNLPKRLFSTDDTPPTPPHLASSRYTKHETLPSAKYGGRYLVTMIPGDGIGEELMHYVREVFKLICAPIDFEVIDFDEPNDIDYIVHSTRRNQCAIKGHMERWYDHNEHTFDSPNVTLRKKLDLFAYVNEFRSYKNVTCKVPDLDIVLVRQNTEGEYSMLEHETVKGVVNSLKIHTKTNATKIAEFAVDYAKSRNRKKITIVHKANIMKKTDGLFLDVCKDVLKDQKDIEVNSIIVDNACMQMVINPYQYDVILTPNLYGNIMLNMICGLIGGPGIMSASNFGDHCAVFEPTCRNRAMNLKGKNLANPTSFLNAGVLLLSHLRFHVRSEMLREAIRTTIEDDHLLTNDLGGTCQTDEFMNGLKVNLCRMMHTGEDGEVYCPSFCEDDNIENGVGVCTTNPPSLPNADINKHCTDDLKSLCSSNPSSNQ